MRLLTKEQAQELDHTAINKMGICGVDLMGKAGAAVAKHVLKMVATIDDPKVAIICGKGNNAGDGYKAAIELKLNEFNPDVYIIPEENKISGDALFYYTKCIDARVPVFHALEPPIKKYNLIIDALLGTGFHGKLRKPCVNFTKWINKQKSFIVAVDIPSGIDANSGQIAKNSVKADTTITFGMTKVGMVLEPGKSHCGKIIIEDIGFPNIYDKLSGLKFRTATEKMCYEYLGQPAVDTHKYKQGKILIIAGSRGMTGAAILAANAALKSGVGLVALVSPKSLNDIYETNIIEGLTISCEDAGDGYFKYENYAEIMKHCNWADAILIGPGLGKQPTTIKLIKKIVANSSKPLIIDADGLHCFSENLNLFNKIKSDVVITPHYGEFARLIGYENHTIKSNVVEHLTKFMTKFPETLVLKNAPTITTHKNEAVVNTSGNQGLASAGTGDVLSGIITSFIAQGISPTIAAELGVFVHGKAAEYMTDQNGIRGTIATDIVLGIGPALKKYE